MSIEKTTRIAVDIGGTFVDAVKLNVDSGVFELRKSSTTPKEPWLGVMNAIRTLDTDLAKIDTLIHGTTLGLNSLLERKGGKTGIITNDGFRDVFLIGRANVPDADMYNFQYSRPEPLVPRHRIMGVGCRRNYKGEIEVSLSEDDVRKAATELVEKFQVTAIAVCFLYSYVNPEDERQSADIIKEMYPEIVVSISSDIAREHREYERTSTTVLDAYIRPVFNRYMEQLEKDLTEDHFSGRFLVMRSGGGAMTAVAAKSSPTHTVMSGPAGGIAGAEFISEILGLEDTITFDVGGTSLDVCKIEAGRATTAFEATLENHPLLIPVYDIRSIGAGGGSIAWIEQEILKVGPHSAGAEPGPICYGRGGLLPTVTDAAVHLGYIDPVRFLGGDMELDAMSASLGIKTKLAEPLGISEMRAASGIFDILLAKTVGAVRQITVERGRDPATATLLGFGGAGPMLAPLVAHELEIASVIIPVAPSGFSAWGMLSADVVDDYALTMIRLLDDIEVTELESMFKTLEQEAFASLIAQGVEQNQATLVRQLELRYLGQEHALAISVGRPINFSSINDVFVREHEKRYGHTMDAPIQVLNLRIRGIGAFDRPQLPQIPLFADGLSAVVGSRNAFCFMSRELLEFVMYDRKKLGAGASIDGPALIDEGTSVTVIHSNQSLVVDQYGNLLISTGV